MSNRNAEKKAIIDAMEQAGFEVLDIKEKDRVGVKENSLKDRLVETAQRTLVVSIIPCAKTGDVGSYAASPEKA